MMNTELFSQIGLDSGALTLLGSIAHRMDKTGRYKGTVLLDDIEVGDFELEVVDDGPLQLNIDLAGIAGAQARDSNCGGAGETGTLAIGGYLLFHVASGNGHYAALINSSPREDSETVFDSRHLAGADVFSAVVLRPGRYVVTNVGTDAKAFLEVTYPEQKLEPYRPPEPIQIKVGQDFSPSKITVGSAQGQVYQLESEGRILIDLVEPYDPPSAERKPRYRSARRQRYG